MSKNAGAVSWCITELSFYDKSGKRIPTQPSGGSAQSFIGNVYAAGKTYLCIPDHPAYILNLTLTTTHPYPTRIHWHISLIHTLTLKPTLALAGKAFNEVTDKNADYYCSQVRTKIGWLQYDFGKPTAVASYRMQPFDNTSSPVDWVFQGSSDGSSWSTLDTQRGHSSWGDEETKSFTLPWVITTTAISTTTSAKTTTTTQRNSVLFFRSISTTRPIP